MAGRDGSALPGAWPTPDAAMHGGANTSPGPAGARPNISLAAKQWLTPHGMTGIDSTGNPTFPEQAAQWLTPNVPNGGRSVSAKLVASKGMTEDGEKKTVGLESQTRHWGTPQARDYRSPDSPDSPNYQRKLAEGYSIDLNSQAANWASQEPAEGLARPTPRATDGTKGGPNQAGSKGDLMLPSAAAQWHANSAGTNSQSSLVDTDAPTATAKDSTPPVLAWPTPAARDAKGANSSEHVTTNGTGRMHMDQLPNFVEHGLKNWPTPSAGVIEAKSKPPIIGTRKPSDPQIGLADIAVHHFSPLDPATPSGATTSTRVVSVSGSELSPTTRPVHVLGRLRLNPAFVCWLMGWPFWWTNPGITSSVKAEMVSYRCALQWHLSNYCAAPALRGDA